MWPSKERQVESVPVRGSRGAFGPRRQSAREQAREAEVKALRMATAGGVLGRVALLVQEEIVEAA